jgi:hypothetical protein
MKGREGKRKKGWKNTHTHTHRERERGAGTTLATIAVSWMKDEHGGESKGGLTREGAAQNRPLGRKDFGY